VDNQMRSADDHAIYVAGECAQHRGKVYGLVAPLWEQAKVFADHITGADVTASYHGSKLATKLKVMGVELASMGLTSPADDGDETARRTAARHLHEAHYPRQTACRRHPDGRDQQDGPI
jgi:nitrite reductase (NADH) large subunit